MHTVTHTHPIIRPCILLHTPIPSYSHAYCHSHSSHHTAMRTVTGTLVPSLYSHAYCHSHPSHHTAIHTVIRSTNALMLIPLYSHAYCHSRSSYHTDMHTVTHTHPIIHSRLSHYTATRTVTHTHPIMQPCVLSCTLVLIPLHIFTHSFVGVHTLTIPTRSPSRFESYNIRHPHITIRQGGATLNHSDINA